MEVLPHLPIDRTGIVASISSSYDFVLTLIVDAVKKSKHSKERVGTELEVIVEKKPSSC